MEIVPIESAYPGFGELVVSMIVDNYKSLQKRWDQFLKNYLYWAKALKWDMNEISLGV